LLGLQPYFNAAKPMLEKYPTNEFNPKEGAAMLAELGWTKDGSGMYADSTGKPLPLEFISASSISPRSAPCWWSYCAGRG